jgi:hypothetical protein
MTRSFYSGTSGNASRKTAGRLFLLVKMARAGMLASHEAA